MILSVSRRTDIPAFHSEWFYNRINEGEVYVRNPMNVHSVSKIKLSSDIIECIVFWTKNPSQEFIDNVRMLDEKGYKYYFQFTITSYDNSIEKNVPEKKMIMQKFRSLSGKIGKEKIIWRYDPIFINDTYSIDYHCKYFEYIASKLSGYTNKCVISFIDKYAKIKKRLEAENITELSFEQMKIIGKSFSEIGKKHNIEIETCCEKIDLLSYGIRKGHCIDGELIKHLTNKPYIFKKDACQRKDCGCIASVDIGSYNSCSHNCLYCYANWEDDVKENEMSYDFKSPILCSELKQDDKISERKITSCPLEEGGLFNN